MNTSKTKELMLESLKKNLGNVSLATKEVGIDRTTHYNWMKKDKKYKKAVNEMDDFVLDFAENALFKNINKGNVTAQIFYLKTKGKKRGYVEQTNQEITHKGDGFKLVIEQPD